MPILLRPEIYGTAEGRDRCFSPIELLETHTISEKSPPLTKRRRNPGKWTGSEGKHTGQLSQRPPRMSTRLGWFTQIYTSDCLPVREVPGQAGTLVGVPAKRA